MYTVLWTFEHMRSLKPNRHLIEIRIWKLKDITHSLGQLLHSSTSLRCLETKGFRDDLSYSSSQKSKEKCHHSACPIPFNKIVFTKTWYVSARHSSSSKLQCLHNLSCIYSMYVSNNLWYHFQQCPWEIGSVWAERVGQGKVASFPGLGESLGMRLRGRWVGIYTQRVKTAWVWL